MAPVQAYRMLDAFSGIAPLAAVTTTFFVTPVMEQFSVEQKKNGSNQAAPCSRRQTEV